MKHVAKLLEDRNSPNNFQMLSGSVKFPSSKSICVILRGLKFAGTENPNEFFEEGGNFFDLNSTLETNKFLDAWSCLSVNGKIWAKHILNSVLLKGNNQLKLLQC